MATDVDQRDLTNDEIAVSEKRGNLRYRKRLSPPSFRLGHHAQSKLGRCGDGHCGRLFAKHR
jgi:hypothetical protein